MFGSFIFAGLAIQIAWAEKVAEHVREVQCADNTNCAADACNVLIGDKLYCSQCDAGSVPINGKCVGKDGATDKCKDSSGGNTADQTCGQCAGQTFMYKGGCYEAAQQPGQTMCTQASEGKCTQAAQGYFVPPGADVSHQSVIPCGDATGITLGDKTYTGVAGCTTCDGSALTSQANGVAKCTACGPDAQQTARIVKTDGGATSCVTEQECTGTEGFFVDTTGGKKCSKCAETCKTCKTGAAKCTPCKDDKPYLKKDDESTTGTCVDANGCPATHYVDKEAKECNTCASGGTVDCATCEKGPTGVVCKTCGPNKKIQPNKKGCVESCPLNSNEEKTSGVCECVEGYVPDNAGTGCTKKSDPQCNTPGCKTCSEPKTSKEVCTECEGTKALTPTGQCIDNCGDLGGYYAGTNEGGKKACKKCEVENCLLCNENGQCDTCKDGYYKSGAACAKCDTSCKTCANGNSNGCTSCEPKKALSYEGEGNTGTCKPGCEPNANNCEKCELTVNGTAYCSKCKDAGQFPQNGVCSAAAGKAITCTTQGSGVCNKCANGLLRMNGGCYETTKFPGKSVCLAAAEASDACQTPADGYKLDNGALTTCSAGCKTCTSQDQCDTCKAGYAKTGGNTQKCVPCATGCSECNANDATKCTVCAAGYYLSKEKCIACDKSDGGSITGVANCASCAPPSAGSGSVLCYLIKDGDSTDGSTNKSGLSTGAIAGISVAVIVVVGGLVGFLCWWFICRGKA
eukprot:XP_001704664.1 VSP [Giardia lamblia ATCC 50803]